MPPALIFSLISSVLGSVLSRQASAAGTPAVDSSSNMSDSVPLGNNYYAPKIAASLGPSLVSAAMSGINLAVNKRMQAENRAYNSPANQMALMAAAGINPNAAAAGISKSPYYSNPVEANLDASPESMAAGLNGLGDLMFDQPERNSRASLNDSNRMLNMVEYIYKPLVYNETLDDLSIQKKISHKNYQILKAEERYRDSILGANLDLLLNKLPIVKQELDNVRQEYENLKQEYSKLQGETNLVNQKVETEKEVTQLVGEQVETQKEETKGKQIFNMDAEQKRVLDSIFGGDYKTANVCDLILRVEKTHGTDAANSLMNDIDIIQYNTAANANKAATDYGPNVGPTAMTRDLGFLLGRKLLDKYDTTVKHGKDFSTRMKDKRAGRVRRPDGSWELKY